MRSSDSPKNWGKNLLARLIELKKKGDHGGNRMTLSQIFLDRRQKHDDTQPKRRWSDLENHRKKAMEGIPMPMKHPPRYKVEDIRFVSRGEIKSSEGKNRTN